MDEIAEIYCPTFDSEEGSKYDEHGFAEIKLYEEHLAYSCKCRKSVNNPDDPMMEQISVYVNIRTVVRRQDIKRITRFFSHANQAWEIDVFAIDQDGDLDMLYQPEDRKRADKCFDTLVNWWLETKPDLSRMGE